MKLQRLRDFCIPKNTLVSLKEMGHVSEIMYQSQKNNQIYIKKLSDNEYVYLPTGEVLDCNHIKNRSESLAQVHQSLKRLRDYINFNVQCPQNCKWITLTYAENMQDTQRLYIDFKNFMKRLKYTFKAYKIEYIVAMEPQARGAWHCHLILVFDRLSPFIPNKLIQRLWQQGFTKTKNLDNVDNVGAYLTAYLGDMPYDEFLQVFPDSTPFFELKDVSQIEGIKLNVPKKFVKGGRLYLYPPKFNLYRCSRGIKKPISVIIPYEEAKKKIGSLQPTFSTAIQLSDENTYNGNSFKKTIAYEFYNSKRNVPQC